MTVKYKIRQIATNSDNKRHEATQEGENERI